MASIVLSAAGSALGGAAGGTLGAAIGGRFGNFAGGFLDQKVFGGGGSLREIHGARLAELGVQSSTYGKMVPVVFGTARLAGNIIWSRPIKEIATTTTSSAPAGGGKGGGGRVTQSSTTYDYYVTLAIAICEGPIDAVLRIWADAKQLDTSLGTYRMYLGDEAQTPDSAIVAAEGASRAPAHRGLAYVVLEDFPLADFGNRIPNFTFEVQKKTQTVDYAGEITEEKLTAVMMIPGAGEYVYDTQSQYKVPGYDGGAGFIQQGAQIALNQHTPFGKANSLVAVDQLEKACPNVDWVGVVVAWFGNSLDAAVCEIKPGVEYHTGGITHSNEWGVAGYTRATARPITLVSGNPQYGGTPDDDSVVRLVQELKDRGKNVFFYPIVFMDVAGKPWRGELTGTATAVSNFFTKTNGYNAFINHYANLLAGKVDAFAIGSELVGLTKVTPSAGTYPAVSALVSLAASVKAIMGAGTKLTYAADWSEYHHADGGWYHMDPLWASANIDFIGIDAYFPIKDSAVNSYDIDTLKAGWTSGEGVDYYYTDPARTVQAPLSPAYAWKNISWFWNNTHTNPLGGTTAWVPNSKKIWFTEFGFPSVDNCANQPNVFYDPSASASAFPYHSKGRVDFRAQRACITATLHQWAGSSMVERMFLWTWDARPFPYWPDLTNVWSDGGAWQTGHWVQGKFGISSLSSVVSALLARAGLTALQINTSALGEQVEGVVLTSQLTVRQALEQLQRAYFFDVVESEHRLKAVPRGGSAIVTLDEDDCIPLSTDAGRDVISSVRAQEIELPRRVNVVYLSRLSNYQPATQYAERQTTLSQEIVTVSVPLVLPDQVAKNVADVTLFGSWVGRESVQLMLPMQYAHVEPADVLGITSNGFTRRVRVTRTHFATLGALHVEAVVEDQGVYDFYTPPSATDTRTQAQDAPTETRLELLDIAALPSDGASDAPLRFAAAGLGSPWAGAAVFRSDDGGVNYNRLQDAQGAAVMGQAVDVLPAFAANVFDRANTVTVVLLGAGSLQSVSELAVLSGANAALLGDEILQFTTATLTAPGTYQLSGLLRGRLGTEAATGTHVANERFVLLSGGLGRVNMPAGLFNAPRLYKAVTVGSTLAATNAQSFVYAASALKPYAPVHVQGARDGAGNLTLTWVRRTRAGGDWLDNVDAPLNETTELYDVEILNGVNVVRTFSALTSPTASYSAAQQTTDFGSPQASVSVRIYQLSAAVGRGYAAYSVR
jgi:hypothetical protein